MAPFHVVVNRLQTRTAHLPVMLVLHSSVPTYANAYLTTGGQVIMQPALPSIVSHSQTLQMDMLTLPKIVALF